MFHTFSAYSLIVRSLLNAYMLVAARIVFAAQWFLFAYAASAKSRAST